LLKLLKTLALPRGARVSSIINDLEKGLGKSRCILFQWVSGLTPKPFSNTGTMPTALPSPTEMVRASTGYPAGTFWTARCQCRSRAQPNRELAELVRRARPPAEGAEPGRVERQFGAHCSSAAVTGAVVRLRSA
jgi:hypothetical protein